MFGPWTNWARNVSPLKSGPGKIAFGPETETKIYNIQKISNPLQLAEL